MRKFLSYGLIAAISILPIALQVCAEPPPAEPIVASTSSTSSNCSQCLPRNWR